MPQAEQLVFGIHTLINLLKHQPKEISKILIVPNRKNAKIQTILHQATLAGIIIESIEKRHLDQMTQFARHQGVAAKCKVQPSIPQADLENFLIETKPPYLFLILDQVQDPHNLGACLRSANAAGANAVITPKDNSASLTPAAIKVACGAAQSTPLIQVTNLARTLRQLKSAGIWCYGLSDKAQQSFYQSDLSGNIALVLGSENRGIRPNVLKQCDAVYTIPMRGMVSSLNVSVAAGICLFETVRQQTNTTMTAKY